MLWFECGLICFCLHQRSNNLPQKQDWLRSLSIQDELLTNYSSFPDSLDSININVGTVSLIVNLFFLNLKVNLFLGGAFSWFLYSPLLVDCDSIVLFLALNFGGFHAAVSGYSCTAFCVNFSFLFAFYSITSGLRYHMISQKLSKLSQTITSYKTINIIVNQLLTLLIENHRANIYWTQINSTIFLFTFIAQIPILYLIFFIQLTSFTKFSLIILGGLNFLCGQSITFLSAYYTRNRLNRCQKQLNRLLIVRNDIDFIRKIQLTNVAEYLIDRQLFFIYGGFEFNQINYLTVILEIISNLLLLIANVGIR
ncbi:uncharacterized protein LOC128391016 [Panonychus citri]|uniref:uncharacterized protein LOC128391016 n=1 Tax=Panonychus citri TaxID=50023 RepID=UPI00230800E1|nr:uncharacterized protein LOC128391016 [Panonychus citri]